MLTANRSNVMCFQLSGPQLTIRWIGQGERNCSSVIFNLNRFKRFMLTCAFCGICPVKSSFIEIILIPGTNYYITK